MSVSDAKRLKHLEVENARLKKLVGEQALDISVLKDVLLKNLFSHRELLQDKQARRAPLYRLCANVSSRRMILSSTKKGA